MGGVAPIFRSVLTQLAPKRSLLPPFLNRSATVSEHRAGTVNHGATRSREVGTPRKQRAIEVIFRHKLLLVLPALIT